MPRIKAKSRTRTPSRSRKDAVELLKADHRQVATWFRQFESARAAARKTELARKICGALRVHTRIEEEIFYPAYLEATGDKKMHHEAEVEHDAAKKLIGEIESSGAGDEFFAARVKVLSEMIRHHVKEEEMRDGLFARARRSDMDLVDIGRQLAERKQSLEPKSGRKPARRFSARREALLPIAP